jgi:DNA/RNA-binding domain of Phe-tRNA-synthetase-like protein
MERACRREFDHIRIGKRRYLTDDQLTAFLAAHTVESRRARDLAEAKARLARRRRRGAAARAA